MLFGVYHLRASFVSYAQENLAKLRGQEIPLGPKTAICFSIHPTFLVVLGMFFKCNLLPLPSLPCSDQKNAIPLPNITQTCKEH